MTKSGKTLITIILTYGIRRLGFWFFNFEPLTDLSAYVGVAVDILLWVVLFYLIAWVLDAVVKTEVVGS
jgi:hypothetical protein